MELITLKIDTETLKKLKKIAAETGEFLYQVVERLAVFELTQLEENAKIEARQNKRS